MHLRHIFLLSLLIIVSLSCRKEGINTINVEGVVRDDALKKPISDIFIAIDGIKSSSGMGIITDGKREAVGQARTDANGYYRVKLKVFKGAERLELYLNPGKMKDGYVERQQDVYISDIDKSGSNKLDFTLSPTAVLKIKFKNVNAVSDSDFFYFGWYANGNGWTKGVIQKENCGTVPVSEALTWTGKDVCGTYTIETIAELETHVYWTVKRNGLTKQYRDSVFVKRGIKNEFLLNY